MILRLMRLRTYFGPWHRFYMDYEDAGPLYGYLFGIMPEAYTAPVSDATGSRRLSGIMVLDTVGSDPLTRGSGERGAGTGIVSLRRARHRVCGWVAE